MMMMVQNLRIGFMRCILYSIIRRCVHVNRNRFSYTSSSTLRSIIDWLNIIVRVLLHSCDRINMLRSLNSDATIMLELRHDATVMLKLRYGNGNVMSLGCRRCALLHIGYNL